MVTEYLYVGVYIHVLCPALLLAEHTTKEGDRRLKMTHRHKQKNTDDSENHLNCMLALRWYGIALPVEMPMNRSPWRVHVYLTHYARA